MDLTEVLDGQKVSRKQKPLQKCYNDIFTLTVSEETITKKMCLKCIVQSKLFQFTQYLETSK